MSLFSANLDEILSGNFSMESVLGSEYAQDVISEDVMPEEIMLDMNFATEESNELESLLMVYNLSSESVKQKSKKKGKVKKGIKTAKRRKKIEGESVDAYFTDSEIETYDASVDTEDSLIASGYEIAYEDSKVFQIELESTNIFKKILDIIVMVIRKIGEFFMAIFNFLRRLFKGGLAASLADTETRAKMKAAFTTCKASIHTYPSILPTQILTDLVTDTVILSQNLKQAADDTALTFDGAKRAFSNLANSSDRPWWLFFIKITTKSPVLSKFITSVSGENGSNAGAKDFKSDILETLFGKGMPTESALLTTAFKNFEDAEKTYNASPTWKAAENAAKIAIKNFQAKIVVFQKANTETEMKKEKAKAISDFKKLVSCLYKFVSTEWIVYTKIHGDAKKALNACLDATGKKLPA